MYSFYNTKSFDEKENFNNLIDAIKLHDEFMVLGLLRDNNDITSLKTEDNKTIPMIAAETGCSSAIFQAVLEKSVKILDEKSNDGESVETILKAHKRNLLLEQYYSFRQSEAVSCGPACL